MNENYIKYENILINSFVKEIDNCLTKEKCLVDQIFEIVKTLFSIRIECSKRINSLNDLLLSPLKLIQILFCQFCLDYLL